MKKNVFSDHNMLSAKQGKLKVDWITVLQNTLYILQGWTEVTNCDFISTSTKPSVYLASYTVVTM